ncbi:uncharacterized protein [Dermacentor albipictus]|uniref:uncharacterized protein isoform X2 n=1 Tax=Dermacentor albipictus TaxID=60249 RepID=UPI0038FC29C1
MSKASGFPWMSSRASSRCDACWRRCSYPASIRSRLHTHTYAQGATYSLDDFSLPWRLVRHYAQMQLSTYKMATGNPAMRAAIARHNAARMMDLLNHVEMAGSRRAQFGHGSVQVVQESGLMSEVKLVSEVNVYLVASLVAALVILFTAYCSCVIAKHVSCLLKDTVPQPVAQERARLLLQAAE